MQVNSAIFPQIRTKILLPIAISSTLISSVSLGAEINHASLERQTFNAGEVSDNQSNDFKSRILKSVLYWASIKIQNIVTSERIARYTLDIPYTDMALVVSFNYSQLNAQITRAVYQDSSKKAYVWVEEEARKKTVKLEVDFEAKQLARQNAAAQYALLAMARYDELNNKAYQMGLAVHKRLANIDQTINTSIDQRDAYKAGVKLGRAMYKLDASSRGIVMPESDLDPQLSEDELIKADKVSEQDELNFIK